MGCNCQWTETILGLVVIVFSVIVTAAWAKWIVFVAGVLLVIHAWSCKNCSVSLPEGSGAASAKLRSKSKRRRKR